MEVVATTRAIGVTTWQQFQQWRQLQPGSPATASPTAASTTTHLQPCSKSPRGQLQHPPILVAKTSTPPVSSYSPPHPTISLQPGRVQAELHSPHHLTSANTCLDLCKLQGCNPPHCTPHCPPRHRPTLSLTATKINGRPSNGTRTIRTRTGSHHARGTMTTELLQEYTGDRGTSGEGNGTPLQYFCLENPMGRGDW